MGIRRNVSVLVLLGLLLGVHRGYIALWRTGDAEPLQVFPYRAAALPERDRLLLEKGIIIESQSELHRLLQDYLS